MPITRISARREPQPSNDRSGSRARGWLLGGAVAVVVAVVLIVAWALIEPRLLLVDRAVVTSPDVPREFDGARIVFLADIHAGPHYGPERVRDLVARINAEKPDLVVVGGDFVSSGDTYASFVYAELARLRAPEGVVAVVGNHDIWEGRGAAHEGLEAAGIRLLDNDNVRIRRGSGWIRIAGTDDERGGRPDIDAAARDIGRDEFAVLLTHTPDVFATALPRTRDAFDLALAGHTHGGQVTAFGLWAPWIPSRYGQRYRGGWMTESGVPILVTRGVGSVRGPFSLFGGTGMPEGTMKRLQALNVPVRFFAPPQYHVIELRRGEAGVRGL